PDSYHASVPSVRPNGSPAEPRGLRASGCCRSRLPFFGRTLENELQKNGLTVHLESESARESEARIQPIAKRLGPIRARAMRQAGGRVEIVAAIAEHHVILVVGVAVTVVRRFHLDEGAANVLLPELGQGQAAARRRQRQTPPRVVDRQVHLAGP